MATELSKSRRKIRRLEDCLRDVLRWCSDQEIELNAAGADNDECAAYQAMKRLRRRVWRTLPPNRPFGLNVK